MKKVQAQATVEHCCISTVHAIPNRKNIYSNYSHTAGFVALHFSTRVGTIIDQKMY